MRPEGVIVPRVTPLRGEGGVDVEGMGRLAEAVSRGGASGVFVAGTTGEGPLLSREERLCALRAVLESGGAPAWIGTATPVLLDAVEIARSGLDLGASGVVLYTPYYYPLGEAALERFYRGFLERVDAPTIIYVIPSHGVNRPPPGLLERLAGEYSQLAGVKVTTSDAGLYYEYARSLAPLGVSVAPGDPRLLPLAHYLGQRSAVLGLGNLLPSTSSAAARGDPSAVGRLLQALSLAEGSPLPCTVKAVLPQAGHHRASRLRDAPRRAPGRGEARGPGRGGG